MLTAVMVAPLASCGEQTTDDDVATSEVTDIETSAETEGDVSPLYEMEQKDYGGREFRISVNEKYTDEMWVEEETGEVTNDAVYNRNLVVEDYFNVKITPIISSSSDNNAQVNEITQSLMAVDDVYDLTAVYTYLAGGPALEGL